MIKQVYYAAIDIGSNAVRLLIKSRYQTDNGDIVTTKEVMLRVPIRLGQDVFTVGEISKEKAGQLMRLIKAYKHVMKIYNIERTKYRACATAALREAANGSKALTKISHKTGIEIEIISGEEEAQIVYKNQVNFMSRQSGNFIYVDVGGGSTDISLITNGELIDSRSFNVGTVRMINNAVKYSEREQLYLYLQRISQIHPNLSIVGSGGNINRLFRLSNACTNNAEYFSTEELNRIHAELKPLSIEERAKQFGLKPNRADVIVPAAEIFLSVAHTVQTDKIYVPTIGLADGIIDSLIK